MVEFIAWIPFRAFKCVSCKRAKHGWGFPVEIRDNAIYSAREYVSGCGLAPRLSQRTLGARGTFDSPARSVIVEIVWSTDATFAQAFARSKRATRIA